MGHQRTGTLPQTDRWREVVDQLSDFSTSDTDVSEIAQRVAENVKSRLKNMHLDSGVQATFQFLVQLTVAARSHDPVRKLNQMGIELPPNPSPLKISLALRKWAGQKITEKDSMEYMELAASAATDTIMERYERASGTQSKMFGEESSLDTWGDVSGGEFSEVAHSYFANFTERYLRYFLDREASSEIRDLDTREVFQEKIAQHAREKAKITQSFAAGWYNKHASESPPSNEEVEGFLYKAFGKLRGELSREEYDE